MRCEVVWTVVKGQSDFAFDVAMVDALPTVRNIANQWPRKVEQRVAERFLRSVATVRIIELAVWTRTMCLGAATIANRRTAIYPVSIPHGCV